MLAAEGGRFVDLADEAMATSDAEAAIEHLSSAIRAFTAAGDNRAAALACARLGDLFGTDESEPVAVARPLVDGRAGRRGPCDHRDRVMTTPRERGVCRRTPSRPSEVTMPIKVNVDSFARAETDRMFADLQRAAGGINRFVHNREPASVDDQAVIRLNRDTLYSFGVVDISGGATLTVPEHGDRYLSAMVVNEDHYVDRIFHEPGEHALAVDELGTPYVLVAVRVLADPTDPDDLAAAADIQDGLALSAESSVPFEMPDHDAASFDSCRKALLSLAAGLDAFDRMFGRRDEVDPVRHLIGTAAGWGGLPTSEATYIGVNPELPVGAYELTVGGVPVDAFWSISVYDADGFFEPNPSGVYSVNSVTGVRNDDGSITVRFGDHGPGAPNAIPVTDGWNYLVRMYRPRPEVLDGRWRFPSLEPADRATTTASSAS